MKLKATRHSLIGERVSEAILSYTPRVIDAIDRYSHALRYRRASETLKW